MICCKRHSLIRCKPQSNNFMIKPYRLLIQGENAKHFLGEESRSFQSVWVLCIGASLVIPEHIVHLMKNKALKLQKHKDKNSYAQDQRFAGLITLFCVRKEQESDEVVCSGEKRRKQTVQSQL